MVDEEGLYAQNFVYGMFAEQLSSLKSLLCQGPRWWPAVDSGTRRSLVDAGVLRCFSRNSTFEFFPGSGLQLENMSGEPAQARV